MQFANDRHVQLIGLFLVIVHVDDELLEHLGLLEIAEILHGLVQRHAALLDEVSELQRIMMDEMHVVHVEALHDVFDVVDDVVEVLGLSLIHISLSVNEVVESSYGPIARVFSSALTLIYTLTLSVVQVISIGTIINGVTGIDATLSMLVGGGIVILYTFVGGMWSVTMTDIVQFVVKTVGILILAPIFCISAAGGWDALVSKVPEAYLSVGSMGSVSYTHLDVYKRQSLMCLFFSIATTLPLPMHCTLQPCLYISSLATGISSKLRRFSI